MQEETKVTKKVENINENIDKVNKNVDNVNENVDNQKNEIAIHEPKMEIGQATMWNNVELFEKTQRMASLLAKSQIVPQNYRNNVADCVIAVDIANRMGVSPMVIMQNSQVVKGNFSWKGTACKAMIDSCGKYQATRYVEVGERGKDSWGYFLQAVDVNGVLVEGPVVDIKMAKAEGWYDKDGSKWKTLPELMLKYRASAFFMRTECASIAMGFLTSEENEDISFSESKPKSALNNMLDQELNK